MNTRNPTFCSQLVHKQHCATVVFGDVESANIVGYVNTVPKFETGYNFIIPTFIDIGSKTATYDLNKIKIIDGDGSGLTEMIVGYDDKACLSGDQWFWNTAADTIMGPDEDCWVDDAMSDTKVENVTLPIGTGLYLNLGTAGAYVQYSGEVFKGSITNTIPQVGYNMIGNATSVAIDLNDIKLIDADGSGLTEMIVGYDDKACLSGDQWFWNTAADTIMGPDEDCWVDDAMSDTKVEGVTLQPGEGVYLNLGTEGAKFTLPSPIKK